MLVSRLFTATTIVSQESKNPKCWVHVLKIEISSSLWIPRKGTKTMSTLMEGPRVLKYTIKYCKGNNSLSFGGKIYLEVRDRSFV